MGFRFRKSFKLMPGIKINLSKSGTSLSLGGKGLTHNISSKGSRTTIGLPGTGLSYTSYSKSKSSSGSAQNNQTPSLQNSTQTPTVNKSNGMSSFGRNLLLLGCVVISVWAIIENSSVDDKKNVTTSLSVVKEQAEETSVSQDVHFVPPELEVVKIDGVSGFMLGETEGRRIPSLDAPSEHQIKSGAGVIVRGTTQNKFWHVIVEEGGVDEYYVPANNVATFTP